MPENIPSYEHLNAILNVALNNLVLADAHLIATNANERTITHRLGLYLQLLIPLWHVDCEYNRDGHDRKVTNLRPRSVQTDDTSGDTAYPDIIVHKRNTDENLLIIEIKKSSNSIGTTHDELKLQSYLRPPLRYSYAAMVIIDTDRTLSTPFTVRWQTL